MSRQENILFENEADLKKSKTETKKLIEKNEINGRYGSGEDSTEKKSVFFRFFSGTKSLWQIKKHSNLWPELLTRYDSYFEATDIQILNPLYLNTRL